MFYICQSGNFTGIKAVTFQQTNLLKFKLNSVNCQLNELLRQTKLYNVHIKRLFHIYHTTHTTGHKQPK